MTEEPAHDPHPDDWEHPLVTRERARRQRAREVEARTKPTSEAVCRAAAVALDKAHDHHPDDLVAMYHIDVIRVEELIGRARDAIKTYSRGYTLRQRLLDAPPSSEIDDATAKVKESMDRALRELERLFRSDTVAECQRDSEAPALIRPADLRPPADWWQERASSRTTHEWFRFTETTSFRDPDPGAAIVAAAEARSALLDNSRQEPPKIVVGQATAFFTMHGLPLPQEVVEALAAALNRRAADRSFVNASEAIEAARRATAIWPPPKPEKRPGEKRAPQSDEPKYRAVVLQVVRWFAERGYVLPAEVFHAVIVALGLSDGRGALRQRVRESVTPLPKPEMRLAGLIVKGEEFPWSRWPSDDDAAPVFEADIDDVEFLRRERPAESRVGMRKPDQFKAAVELEERKRLDFGTEEDEDGELDWDEGEDPSRQETSHRLLARNLSASPNTIRALVASTAYQMVVYTGVFWRSRLSRQWRWRRDDR